MTLPASAFSTKLTHNKERIQTEIPVVEIPQKPIETPKPIEKKQAEKDECSNCYNILTKVPAEQLM